MIERGGEVAACVYDTLITIRNEKQVKKKCLNGEVKND